MSYTTRFTPCTSLMIRVDTRRQQVVRQPRPVGRHEVVRLHRPQGDHVLVGPAVAHHADRLHRQQHRERLRRLAVPARLLAAPPGRSRRPAQERRSRSSVTSPRQRTARPGPGNGCRQTTVLRQAQLQAELAHLVLEQVAQRLDQLEAEFRRQPADVVVRLDRRRRPVRRCRRSRSRRGRACPGPGTGRPRSCFASSLNTSMKTWPMIFRFSCGSVTPASAVEEPVAGVDDVQVGLEPVAERVRAPPPPRPPAAGRYRRRCTPPAARSP